MPIAAYDMSIAVFVRGLTNLKTVLHKGEQHAASHQLPPAALLEARLASDMYNLSSQVHWATEGAKLAVARLVGAAPALSPDDAKTFAELQARIDAAVTQLQTTSADALEAGLGRAIAIEHRAGALHFTGEQFLREFALPNFFFHQTCAYAILRNQGVALTKGDIINGAGGR